MNLSILRNTVEVASVSIDKNTKFSQKLMGEHKITSTFYTTSPIDIQIKDYIVHKGSNYYINRPPLMEKISTISYKYTIVFEAGVYTLYDKLFMDEGASEFSYHGNATDHLNLLLTNINTIDAGWTLGTVDTTESKTITYTNLNCRGALNTIAETFELEYILVGKAITMKKVISENTIIDLEYGRGKGLYTLTRGAVNDENLVTRVYGFGSTKNIDYTYRGGKKRLVFDDLYLENNISLYGVREGVFTDETIYPQRTGGVTWIDDLQYNYKKIRDSSIPVSFDINNYLLEGVTAKIVFKTGDLAGVQFEISSYDHVNREITFIGLIEEDDYKLPNDNRKPEIGDEYTLVDIMMPQAYIDTAEVNLLNATTDFLTENSQPKVTYNLSVDEKFVRDNGLDFQVGYKVSLVDADLGVDTDIRIAEISYPLVNEDLISVVVSDQVNYSVAERVIKKTIENDVYVGNVDRQQADNYRKSVNRTRELQDLVYDPDGYFDTGNIKPLSIDTAMLSVGAKSQNFSLNEAQLQANVGGDENSFNISAGQVIHYEIEIDGLGYVWELPAASFNTLVPTTNYYVYAKCSKVALTGTWYISSTPKKVEDEAGYYLFNLGVLYNVADGRRDYDFTNGMTFINGGTIKTGKIQSFDGLNFFDLEGNTFKMGNATDYISWNGVKLEVTKAEIGDCTITGNTWANGANIGAWLINDGKIVSQAENGSGVPNIELDSVNGEMNINDGKIELTSTGDDLYNRITKEGISIDGLGASFRKPGSQFGSDWNSGIASLVKGGYDDINGDGSSLRTAVYGKSEYYTTNYFNAGYFGVGSPERFFGGYFVRLMARGYFEKYFVNEASSCQMEITSGTEDICTVINSYNNANIYMPFVTISDRGREITIKNESGVTCNVLVSTSNTGSRAVTIEKSVIGGGESAVYIFVAGDIKKWMVKSEYNL